MARWRPALGPLAVAAWAVAVLVWLLDRGGSGLPAAIGTAVATLALAAGAAWMGSWAARAWASGRGRGVLGGERLLLLLARRGSPGVRRAVEVGCLVLVLSQPVVGTVAQDLSMVRLGTRELALDWIAEHVPPGAAFVKESYTPRLDARRYVWRQSRFAARLPLEEVRDPANDFLLLAAPAYGRFLDPANLTQPHHRLFAERYRKLLALPRVREFTPGMTRRGPALALYRLDPSTVEHRRSWRFTTDQVAFASRPALAARADGAAIPFADGGGYVLFKGYFAAGRYRVTLDGELPAGRARLEVVSRDNRPTADLELAAGAATLALPSADKYFLYLHLPPGGTLRGLVLENPGAGGAAGG